MSRFSKITRMAAATAVAAGLTFGLGAVPAQAGPSMSTNLEIRPYPYYGSNTGKYWVTTWGLIPMNQYDAQGYINNGARMELRLWGADWPDGDDFLKGPYFTANEGGGPGQMWADWDGLHFSHSVIVSRSVLNEDSNSGDEIYVNAKFIDGGGGVRQKNSGEVHGSY